jgi:putative membrane protein
VSLLLRWLAAAIAVAVAAAVVPGIEVHGGFGALLGVALLLGLVNAFVRPLVRRLACGLVAVTLGLFLLVINALMLLLTAWLSRAVGIGFEVHGFVAALLGSVVISLVSLVFSLILPGRARPRRR